MGRIFIIVMCVLLAVSLVFGSCTAPATMPAPTSKPTPTPTPTDQKPIVLKGVTFTPKNSSLSQKFAVFADMVKEGTKGQISINYIGGPEVTPPMNLAEAVVRGSADVCQLPCSFYAGLVPGVEVAFLSQLPVSQMYSSKAHDFLVDLHKKAGLYYLGPFQVLSWDQITYVQTLFSNKKLEKFDDLKGLRIGAVTDHALFQSMGMVPSPVAPEEKFTSIERKVVDAVISTLEEGARLRLPEVAPYILTTQWYNISAPGNLICLNTWNKIPADLQNKLNEIQIDYEKRVAPVFTKDETDYKQKLQDAKGEFVKWSSDDADKLINTIYNFKWQDLKQKFSNVDIAAFQKIVSKK
jgi:TRAP-type C4-dicarboxylate transport system substrate-binding protein